MIKKIAVSVPWVPPAYIGGGETYVYYLTQELAKLGLDIDLFSATVGHHTGEWNWQHLRLHESRYLFKVGNTPVMPGLFMNMMACRGYQVIHTAVPSAFACDVSALVARLCRVPLVVTYHCDLASSSGIWGLYGRYLGLVTLRQASRILVSTRSYAQTSPLLRRFQHKHEIVPMGADTTRFRSNKEHRAEIRNRYGITPEQPVVLFVGGLNSFHRFKRVDILIKAMAQLPGFGKDAVLMVVGGGDIMAELQRLSRELGLDNAVFTGYAPNDDLPKYYCAADLFVLPSLTREEAFGIVLVEAAASGAIPICFDIPGPGELCRALGGFVAPIETTISFQDSLVTTIAGALQADLSVQSAACSRNAQRYSWASVAAETGRIYESAVLSSCSKRDRCSNG